jgi:hypothetical protein
MTKGKSAIGQIIIYKALHRKIEIEQHEYHSKPEGKQFMLH